MESNASEGILHKQCDPEGEFVPTYSLFLRLQIATGCDLVNIVICILFGSLWMTYFQLYRTSNNKQLLNFFMHENEAAIGIYGQLLAVCGENIVNVSGVHRWVRKLRYFGGNWT